MHQSDDQLTKRLATVSPVADTHLVRMSAIVRQLAGLQQQLFDLGYPIAGARLAVVAEQIGRDVVDRLHDADLFLAGVGRERAFRRRDRWPHTLDEVARIKI